MLACRRHWLQVSAPVQSLVWNAWAGGMGEGSQEHRDAMMAAIAEMRP
jgi:hypothetical protein